MKQDQKVRKKAGLGHLFHQLPGPGDTGKLLSAGHSVSGGKAPSKARVTASFEGDRTEYSQYKPTEELEAGNKKESRAWRRRTLCLGLQPMVMGQSCRGIPPLIVRAPEELAVMNRQV